MFAFDKSFTELLYGFSIKARQLFWASKLFVFLQKSNIKWDFKAELAQRDTKVNKNFANWRWTFNSFRASRFMKNDDVRNYAKSLRINARSNDKVFFLLIIPEEEVFRMMKGNFSVFNKRQISWRIPSESMTWANFPKRGGFSEGNNALIYDYVVHLTLHENARWPTFPRKDFRSFDLNIFVKLKLWAGFERHEWLYQ